MAQKKAANAAKKERAIEEDNQHAQ